MVLERLDIHRPKVGGKKPQSISHTLYKIKAKLVTDLNGKRYINGKYKTISKK